MGECVNVGRGEGGSLSIKNCTWMLSSAIEDPVI